MLRDGYCEVSGFLTDELLQELMPSKAGSMVLCDARVPHSAYRN
jgi:hypothetical protein